MEVENQAETGKPTFTWKMCVRVFVLFNETIFPMLLQDFSVARSTSRQPINSFKARNGYNQTWLC